MTLHLNSRKLVGNFPEVLSNTVWSEINFMRWGGEWDSKHNQSLKVGCYYYYFYSMALVIYLTCLFGSVFIENTNRQKNRHTKKNKEIWKTTSFCFWVLPEPPNWLLPRVVGRFLPFETGGSNIWNERNATINKRVQVCLRLWWAVSSSLEQSLFRWHFKLSYPSWNNSYNGHESIYGFLLELSDYEN